MKSWKWNMAKLALACLVLLGPGNGFASAVQPMMPFPPESHMSDELFDELEPMPLAQDDPAGSYDSDGGSTGQFGSGPGFEDLEDCWISYDPYNCD